jgi:hypothetical protein
MRPVWTALAVFLLLGTAPALARLPPGDVVPQRLDGPGLRAYAAFRQPDRRCGLPRDGGEGPKIYNSFEGAILRLDFGGEKRRILPLMLTDKPGEGQILKVKVRVPCILAVSHDGAGYRLQVTTRTDPPGLTATLRVNAEGQLLNPADNGGLFYVVGENSRSARGIDRFALLAARLNRFTCLPHESGAACEYQFLNYAERLFADEIRHQSVLPAPDRRQHHAEVDAAVAAAITDPLLLAMHRLIVANESATISPFQVWDAVLAGSGLSFGSHQWDIGINPQGQALFRRLARRAGLAAPERYFRSMWRLSTAEFRAYLLWRPAMDRAMQSAEGRRLIIAAYVAWLRNESLVRARAALDFLDPARPEDRVMLLYYADVDNQYGDEALKSDLRRIIRMLKEAGSGRPAIRQALDARMLETRFALAWPDKARARLERSWAVLDAL